MPKLIAIELEKFQTISAHTVIPIRDLTLMFGPNGAGKSSIFDALELMGILFSADWGKGNINLSSHLDRWARKEGSTTPGNEIGFGLQVQFEKNWSPEGYLPSEIESTLKHIFIASISDDECFSEKIYRFFIKFTKDEFYGEWEITHLSIEQNEFKILEINTEPKFNPKIHIYN
jgi:AAA15 family ATPase/GTPase